MASRKNALSCLLGKAVGKRKGREGFLMLLQLGVQQKEAKSSVSSGVAGSETWQKLSLSCHAAGVASAGNFIFLCLFNRIM